MNYSKIRFCAASLIAGVGVTLTVSAFEATNNAAEPLSRPDYREWTIGLEASTTGLGGYGSWRFYDYLGVRGGFDYFQWTKNNLHIGDFYYGAKVRLMSEPLTLDIYPWKKHSFHISVGMLFNQNQLTGDSTGIGPIYINGQPIVFPNDATLNLKVEQNLVNPYLSIGGNFFYFDRAHHWALGGELGVAYTGAPTVSLTSSRSSALIQAVVNQQQQKAQDWANQLKWLPVVKLMVNYSF